MEVTRHDLIPALVQNVAQRPLSGAGIEDPIQTTPWKPGEECLMHVGLGVWAWSRGRRGVLH